uniref:Uncharacterized protein n=1 Tax=Romanomermis culicivorax TaxID=13658 RepID=A0A915K2E5_ROMCU
MGSTIQISRPARDFKKLTSCLNWSMVSRRGEAVLDVKWTEMSTSAFSSTPSPVTIDPPRMPSSFANGGVSSPFIGHATCNAFWDPLPGYRKNSMLAFPMADEPNMVE